MAGLDSIKEKSSTNEDADTTETSGALPGTASLKIGNQTIKTSGPMQGAELLKAMQEEYNRRTPNSGLGRFNTFLEGMKDAVAITSRDPGSAMAARDAEKRAQQESLFGMRANIAQLQGQLGQQALQAQNFKQNVLGGGAPTTEGAPTTGGAPSGMDPQTWAEITRLSGIPGRESEAEKLYQDFLKTNRNENIKANLNPELDKPQEYFINGAVEKLTIRQFKSLPKAVQQKIEQDTLTRLGYVPPTTATPPAATPPAATPPAAKTSAAISPVEGALVRDVSSTHKGKDIAVPENTPVKATVEGVVKHKLTDPTGYGYTADIIEPKTGKVLVRAAHMNGIVPDGTPVKPGDVIGLSGGVKGAPGAGNSSGPHLHFEDNTAAKPTAAKVDLANNEKPGSYSYYLRQQEIEKIKNKLAEEQATSDIRVGEKEKTSKIETAAKQDQAAAEIYGKDYGNIPKQKETAIDTIGAADRVISLANDPTYKKLMGYYEGGNKSATALVKALNFGTAKLFGQEEFEKAMSALNFTEAERAKLQQLQTDASKLGIEYTAQMFKGARLGIGLEKLGSQGKGISPSFTPETNKLYASITKRNAEFVLDSHKTFRDQWLPQHPGKQWGDFIQSGEYDRMLDKHLENEQKLTAGTGVKFEKLSPETAINATKGSKFDKYRKQGS